MSQTANIGGLLEDSGLDAGAVSQMQLTADALGPAINAGLGDVTIDDITTAEVVLVTVLVDDSSSIQFGGNAGIMREGVNEILDSLKGSKQSASVLISCRYLNAPAGTDHGVLYPYRPLDGAVRLDQHNYHPSGGTPLLDQTAVTLTGVATKMAEFEQGGVAARAVTVIVTDGAEQGSHQYRYPVELKPTVDGLLKSEAHIIAGMGISDGTTDFRKLFQDMGLQDDWILSPKNSESEIRRAFQLVSQSAVRASQAQGGSFSQVALGGFGQ